MESDMRGAMPFAVIAVALLLLSAGCAAVAAAYERAEDASDGYWDDAGAVEVSASGISDYVDRGLGTLIGEVSAGEGYRTQTLEDRAAAFDGMAAGWLDSAFPVVDKGARADLVGYDISLSAVPMRSVPDGSGYMPTYLVGTGTVSVVIETQTGRTAADLDIRTDGSHSLPLAAGQMSVFESMAAGGAVSLSQMMSHQLGCLAQYRVLNGYGSVSEYGSRGTASVITAEDVERAYSNSLEAASMICFRLGDGMLSGLGAADLADLLVPEDGVFTVDPGAIYSQALISAADDLALRWFHYLCGDVVVDALEGFLERYDDINRLILSFFTGDDPFSAAPYIREVMEVNGFREADYRFPGSGTTSMRLGDYEVQFDNPTADLFSEPWIERFVSDHDRERNEIQDLVVRVVNSAAGIVAEDARLEPFGVRVDPSDGETFMEALARAVSDALDGCLDDVADAVEASLEGQSFSDPFYGAICAEIWEHSEEMVMEDEFRGLARGSLLAAGADPDEADALLGTDAFRSALANYRMAVLGDLSVFEVLLDVPGGQPGLVTRMLSEMVSLGIRDVGLLYDATATAERMCSEMLALDGIGPYGGVMDLPSTDGFRLTDGNGNETTERLHAVVTSDPVASVPTVDEDRSFHTVGFAEDSAAAYTTIFHVKLSDHVRYDVMGTGALSGAMGTVSSAVSGGFETLVEFDVAVVSGWALVGVDYSASTTIVGDVAGILIEVLEPIMEPLRAVLGVIADAATFLAESLVDVLRYVAGEVQRLYETVAEPLARLQELVSGAIGDAASGAILEIMYAIGLDDQSMRFEYGGYSLLIETSALSWLENTKTLFSATLSGPLGGMDIEAGATVKVRGDVAAENLIVTFHGGAQTEDWSLEGKLDPLMRGSTHLLTLSGEYGDTEVSAVIPEMVEYHELGLSLGDVPGLGDVLDSIPIPVLGVNLGLDAGFSLKYSTPMVRGLVINEFESNPEGTDTGREWVELYNGGSTAVDLEGYTLTASSDWREKVMELSGTIHPGEFMVVEPDFILVNESGKYTKKGEALTLKDPDGAVVDKTPTMKDTEDDGRTIQRVFDGSTEWVLDEGSMGRTNDSHPLEAVVSAADMKDIAWSAVEDAFGDVGYITDTASLEEFLRSLVHNTLDGLVEHITGQIVEASMYVSVDVRDLASVSETGFRVALRTDGDLAEDVLKYLVGKVEELLLNMDNPYDVDPGSMFTDNIDLEVMFHTSIGFPEFLGGGEGLPRLDLGVVFRANLSSLTELLGWDSGTPEVVCGVAILDCPAAAVPSKISVDDSAERDLWLFRLTVRFA